MKRTTKTVLICLIILALAIGLTACAPAKGTEPEEKTVPIGTADEFRSLSQKLGYEYSKTTFELTSDIELGTNWTPIGGSLSDSFRGILDGKGHTVSYTVNVSEPNERPLNLEGSAAFGLFGYVFDATVKNINIDFDVRIPGLTRIAYSPSGEPSFTGAANTYIGGVAGYAYGDCKFEHIALNGSIQTTMGDILRSDKNGQESVRNTGIEFLGGAVGYGIGNSEFFYVESEVDISVGAYGQTICRVADVYAGGIAGYLRPVDITSDHTNPKDLLELTKCSHSGVINVVSETANVGGIAGSVYNASIDLVECATDGYSADVLLRMNIGGLAGLADRCKVTDAAAVSVINMKRGTNSAVFNGGGLFGQAVNFCEIESVYADSDIIGNDKRNCTVGGIAGILSYSSLKDAAAEGGYGVIKGSEVVSIMDVNIDYTGVDYSYYTHNGGIAGRLAGSSSLTNVVTEFEAFQGIAGETLTGNDVAVCKLALHEDGKSDFDVWKESHSLYDYSVIAVECLSVDVDADRVQYLLTHTYKLVDPAKINFYAANTRADKDITINSSILPNGVGTEELDEQHLPSIKNNVTQNIATTSVVKLVSGS